MFAFSSNKLDHALGVVSDLRSSTAANEALPKEQVWKDREAVLALWLILNKVGSTSCLFFLRLQVAMTLEPWCLFFLLGWQEYKLVCPPEIWIVALF